VSRRIAHVVAAIAVAALLICAATPAAASPSRRVVVLLAPYLTWTDITGGSMPNAAGLARRAVLADMNVRAGAITGASTPDRGAIVLSAGAPMTFADGAISAFEASETVGVASATNLYRQYFGLDPGASRVLFIGQPRQVLANLQTVPDDTIGGLGSAAHAIGAKTAAIGCGDLGFAVDPPHASRPAGEAAADVNGAVDLGDVSKSMLVKDPLAPYGTRSNVERILATYHGALAAGAGLLIVDPGDLSRATAIASYTTTSAAASIRTDALRSTDEVLGGLMGGLQPGDAIVVLSQAILTDPTLPAGYGPLIIAGPGAAGLGVAASTHRDGIVTEMDVTASIVQLLGAKQPATMIGSPVRTAATFAGGSVAERTAYLDQLNTTSIAVESVRLSTVNVFIVLAVVIMLASALILYRGTGGLPSLLPSLARGAVLMLVCIPLASVLQFAVVRWPTSGGEVLGLLVAVTAVCLLVAWAAGRGRAAALPLIVITGATTLVLLVDQYVGAPLSFTQIFGYSPLLGARYYGMGNEMAGLLFGSVVIAVALVLDTWRDARWARHLRTWGWPVIAAVTLLTAAAPFWGANVGPVAWMTVGFLVGWMLLNGRKVWTWRNLVVLVVIVAAVLAGLTAVDLLRGSGAETHLGRAVSGGVANLWTIIARKADTNVRVLGRTNWTWMLVAVLLLLGYMRWRPRGEFAALLKQYPAYSAALAAALFAGVAGYLTEDSGIIIPALMFIPVGVSALYLMLAHPHEQGSGPS
jgi:hypothetical protein